TRGLKNTRSLTAASTADPNNPTLENQASKRLRPTWLEPPSFSLSCPLGTTGMIVLLDQVRILQVAPKDLVFDVFDVAEIVFFNCEDEDAERRQRHNQAGCYCNPGQFHGPEGTTSTGSSLELLQPPLQPLAPSGRLIRRARS